MNNKEIQVCMANFRIKWDHSIRTRVCPNGHILFFCTKPRLSQARALLFPKVFIPLGIQNYNAKDTLSFLHTQPNAKNRQRYCEVPQIVSADNLSNTKKEERITLHLLMEFAREELSLIKYKTKRRKIIKVHLSLCFVIKYTFSTP